MTRRLEAADAALASELTFERTAADHYIAMGPGATGARSRRAYADVELRCGSWLWWTRDGGGIGLCRSLDAAEAAVRACVRTGPTGFVPPTVEDVEEYMVPWCRSNRIDPSRFDAGAFVDYYDAAGWTVSGGRRLMRDWRSSARAWARREAR